MARYILTLTVESGEDLDIAVQALSESDLGTRDLDRVKIEIAS